MITTDDWCLRMATYWDLMAQAARIRASAGAIASHDSDEVRAHTEAVYRKSAAEYADLAQHYRRMAANESTRAAG